MPLPEKSGPKLFPAQTPTKQNATESKEMSRPSSQTSQLALKAGVACPKAVECQRGGSEKTSSRDRDWGLGEGVILWRVGAMPGNPLHLLPFKPAGHSFV